MMQDAPEWYIDCWNLHSNVAKTRKDLMPGTMVDTLSFQSGTGRVCTAPTIVHIQGKNKKEEIMWKLNFAYYLKYIFYEVLFEIIAPHTLTLSDQYL